MDYKKHPETGEYYASFKSEYIGDDSYYRLLSDVLHEFQASEAFKYETMYNFLVWIQESDFECIEDAEDLIHEFLDLEVPVYTADLTNWLSESNYHVFYIDDAINEHCQSEGFKVLSSAYYLAAQELCFEIITAIENEV